jgi:hypothetical protein
MTDLQSPDRIGTFEALDEAHEALHALAELVVTAAEAGTDLKYVSYGLSVLFRQQSDDARDATQALRDAFRDARQPAPASRRLDPSNPLYEDVVKGNAEILAEMRALRADKDALRREVMQELAEQEVGHVNDIAEATKLKPETVERVIAALVGARPAAGAGSAAQAV